MSPKTLLFLLAASVAAGCALVNPPLPKPAADPPPAATAVRDPAAAAAERLSRLAGRFQGEAGIYAKNLRTGGEAVFQPDRLFPTASTHKLIVALAVYKYLYPEAGPSRRNNYHLEINRMMTVSDNPSFYRLLGEIERVRPDAMTRVLSDLGLRHTRIHSREAFLRHGYHSVTTPREMAAVFEAIYREQYLGAELSGRMKRELSRTIFHDEIPRFMQQVRVMHKTGELPGMMCDVGVVDDGRDPVLISAYTVSPGSAPRASNFLAEASAQAYQALRAR